MSGYACRQANVILSIYLGCICDHMPCLKVYVSRMCCKVKVQLGKHKSHLSNSITTAPFVQHCLDNEHQWLVTDGIRDICNGNAERQLARLEQERFFGLNTVQPMGLSTTLDWMTAI